MEDTVKSYLSQKYKSHLTQFSEDGVWDKYEIKSIDIKLDTIPEYFNEIIEGTSTECSLANKAVISLQFLRDMNSPRAQMQEAVTGQPYSIYSDSGLYSAENAYADLAELETQLASVKQNTVPAVAYVAYVVEKFRYANDTEDREKKEIVVLDTNNPHRILKSYSFYGLTINEIATIKYVQAQGNMKTDTFGRIVTTDWYNVERFILSDRLDGDIIQLLGLKD